MMPRGVKVALGGWAAFAGTHMLMSHPPVRSKLIELSGSEYNYRLGYCAVAAATLGTAVTMYVRTPTALKGPIMHQWHRRTGLRRISGLIRAVSSVFIIDSYLTPISNPVGMLSLNSDDPTDARKLQRKYQVFGLQRMTRHYEFFGWSLFATGMMMVRPRLADLVLWAGLPIFCIVGALHQDYRQRKHKPEQFYKETSFIPFTKLISGEHSWAKMFVEIPASAYATGFCVAGMIFLWP